jgi:curved DNA-binding protein CbpA
VSDPYLILGVPEGADDAAVHAAYLAAIKACPPERDPQRFAAVRQAYESLRTRRDRLAHELFDREPPTVQELLDRAAPAGLPGRPTPALFAALLRGGR